MNNKIKKFIVYIHKFPNGKMYIGITSKKPNARWQNGNGYSKEKQPIMYNAIKKYGWENIEHIIMFSDLSENDAKSKEIELIKKYNTFYKNENSNGYNMTFGGDGVLGHKSSKKVKEYNRKRLLGKTGDLCINSKSVICDGIRYESLTDFCNKNKLKRQSVGKWLKGENHMPKKWFDKNLRFENEEDKRLKTPSEKNFSDKIEYDGRIYNSQSELAKELKVSSATLCNWMNGKTRIPKNIYEKGLKFIDKENKELKVLDKKIVKEIYYDGKIFKTQVSLSKFLNVNKATLNDWLTGKNKMPIKYKEKGLSYHNI